MRSIRMALCTALVAAVLPAAAAAQTATFTGAVRSTTQSPVRGAIVAIPSLDVSTVTNDQGLYRLVVPEGQVRGQQASITVTSIGYSTTEATVTVGAGAHVQDFTMEEEAISLDEVIVTGTAGRQERRAQAATIASINAQKVAEVSPVTNIASMIQARTPGVMLRMGSGTAGTAQTIRIRGQASITLDNEPLIFIDGIRADSRDRQVFGVGGQSGSRLNDLALEDIESIEIVKGPAAATLYGADASAGVIQIITKRGRATGGFTQSITAEYGKTDAAFDAPDNYGLCTANFVRPVADGGRPGCQGLAANTVVNDNPLRRYDAFRKGTINNLTWSLRGGGERYGAFLSVGADEELGTLPNNRWGRISGRANFDFVPNEKVRLDFGFGVIRASTRLPRNDNDIYGFLGGGLLGNPTQIGGATDGWYGSYRQTEALSAFENRDRSYRIQPRFAVNYTPVQWFANRFTFGGDLTRSEATAFFPKNDIGWWDGVDLNRGQIQQAREAVDRLTLDYQGTMTWNPLQSLRTDFTFGSQLLTRRTDITNATGIGLVSNIVKDINAAATSTGGNSRTEERSVGFFGQAAFAYNEKLYVQLAGRVDQASAFGADADPFFSPRAGVSYVLSDENFFQNAISPNIVSTLRLRGAYGQTGRSPSSGARSTYNPTPYAIAATQSENGLVPQNPGNPSLKPERGTELELGFDAGLLNERLGLELTYFNKKTEDLILARPLAGSLGFGANPLYNIGSVVNRGFEVAANARVLTYDNFAWEVRATGNTLHNEVLDMGTVEPFGTRQRTVEGFPIGAEFAYRILRFENGADGVPNLAIVSDTLEFIGNPQNLPGWESTLSTTFTIFRNLSLYAQMDGRGDVYVFNSTDEFRERQFGIGERWVRRAEVIEPEESLRRFGPFQKADGTVVSRGEVNTAYIESGGFWRLREMSATYRVPRALTQRLIRASGLTLTAAARNVEVWTDYTGLDPETGQFLTVPQDKKLILRAIVTF
jgi:TonB-dependent starch-binding outer membrane protein SusC